MLHFICPSCPKFTVTQSPLPVTLVDFWTMVYEQGVEVVVTLSSETEVGKVSHTLYVPHVPSLLQHNHHYQGLWLISGLWFMNKALRF